VLRSVSRIDGHHRADERVRCVEVVDEKDRVDGDVHEVPDPEYRERQEQPPVFVVGPDVARDDSKRPARRDLRRAVVAHPEERDRPRQPNERRGGEDPCRGDDVDERPGDGGGRDARDRAADPDVRHGRCSLAVRVNPVHERGVCADVRDADDEGDHRRHREHERRRGDEDAGEERGARDRHSAGDDSYLRKAHEQIRRDR